MTLNYFVVANELISIELRSKLRCDNSGVRIIGSEPNVVLSDSALLLQLTSRNLGPVAEACLFDVPECTGTEETGGGVFRGTTAGILQPNGHVFILGCFLIAHWNQNNNRKKGCLLLRPQLSKQTPTL